MFLFRKAIGHLSSRRCRQYISFASVRHCVSHVLESFVVKQILSPKQRNNSNYTVRRALLYVPGDDVRKISKIKELNADCIVLDCEDGVAINSKAKAREEINTFLNMGSSNGRTEIAVRLNSIDSGLFEQDLEAIVSGKCPPTTLVLPKVNSTADTRFVSGFALFKLYARQSVS